MERPVREEEERDQEPLRHLAVAQDLREIIVRDAARREGHAEQREEDSQLKRARAVTVRDRVKLENAEQVRQPTYDDDEEPAHEERQFRDWRLLAAHSRPTMEGACKKSPM